jgi:hypothetical protein
MNTMKTNPAKFRTAVVRLAVLVSLAATATAYAQRIDIDPATGLPVSGPANAPGAKPGNRPPGVGVAETDISIGAKTIKLAGDTASVVHQLINKGQYDEALRRCLSFHDQFKASDTIPITFLLRDWIELGRRFPKAKAALLEIRDQDIRECSAGRGYLVLFREAGAINGALHQDDATYALFKTLRDSDPDLAQQCTGYIEDLLVAKGEYQWCFDHLGDPQEKFDSSREHLTMDLEREKRMDESRNSLMERNRERGITNRPAPPDRSAWFIKHDEDRFVGETRRLIEILVATGHKADAEKIRHQAVAVLDDPRLKSAVSDAEEKIHRRSAPAAATGTNQTEIK